MFELRDGLQIRYYGWDGGAAYMDDRTVVPYVEPETEELYYLVGARLERHVKPYQSPVAAVLHYHEDSFFKGFMVLSEETGECLLAMGEEVSMDDDITPQVITTEYYEGPWKSR